MQQGRSNGLVVVIVATAAASIAIALTVFSLVKTKSRVKEKLRKSNVEMYDVSKYGLRPRSNAIWEENIESLNNSVDHEKLVTRSKRYERVIAHEHESKVRESRTKIVSVPADGDCLFHSITMAVYEDVGSDITVDDLRQIVADNIDEETFETLHTIYKSAKKEKDYAIIADYMFMKDVETIDDLRRVIATDRSYWGDEMAVRILQEQLGISFLIFTRQSGKIKLSQQYGEIAEPYTGKYLMLMLETLHYSPIRHKGRFLHEFGQLPPEVRKTISKSRGK